MPSDWNKIKNLVNGLKDLSTIGLANVIAAVISGIFWFYIAALLGAQDFGKVNYFIAIATIGFAASYLGSGNTVLVYTVKENKIQSSIYFFTIISGIFTSIVVFFIFYNFGVSLFVIGSVIFGLATSELLAKKLYKDYSKYVITQRILLVGLAILLYYLIGIDGIILGFALSYFPYFLRIYRGITGSKIDLSTVKLRSSFIMNVYVLDLSRVLSASVDKLFIFPLYGSTLLGSYSLGIQFLVLLTILPSTVYQYLLPYYASGNSKNNIKNITILISVFLATSGIVLSPVVVPILFPRFNAVEMIQIMSFAIVPVTISYVYEARFVGIEKSKIVLLAACIYLSAQILGIFILGKIFDINGPAIALVLGAVAKVSYLMIANDRIKEKSPPKN